MAMRMGSSINDATWFPVDLHVPRREFAFLQLDADVLERSTFLDTRIEARLETAESIPVDWIQASANSEVSWLLHTSFCCSTLLARALHLPLSQVVLKEPLVLRRLGDARDAGWMLNGMLEPAVCLLARPWTPGGTVVIKPTHAALNVAGDLLAVTPRSHAVLMTSSLEDFIISNIKKTADTQTKIPQLAARALRAGRFHDRLPRAAFAPPNLLSAATLQWAAQRELCADLLERYGSARLRVLATDELLDDLTGTAISCARWFRLPVSEAQMRSRVGEVASANAKAVDVRYDAASRRRDAAKIRAQYAAQLDSALGWFDRMVRPAMRALALRLEDDRLATPVHAMTGSQI